MFDPIVMLDIAYYLVTQQQYEQIKVRNEDTDIWLINRTRDKFPIIRITANKLEDYRGNKTRYINDAERVSKLYNSKNDLLNIHVSEDDSDLFFEPGYYQGVVTQAKVSPIISDMFPNIQRSILSQGENFDEELKVRKQKIEQYYKKANTKVKNKSLLASVWKNHSATTVLIIINCLMFLASIFISMQTSDFFGQVFLGALYKPLVYGANEWWRLIASGFVHADFFHLMMNMIALLSLGTFVERVYGVKAFLSIYFVSLISGSLLALIKLPGNMFSLGASGAIYGLMGATIVYLFSSGLYKFKQFRTPIIQNLLLNFFISLMPNVSWEAHLGGLIAGALMTLVFTKTPIVKQTIMSVYLSLVLLFGGMFTYAFAFDNEVQPISKQNNMAIAYNYIELGMTRRGLRLIEDFNAFYESLGEEY